MYCVIHVVSNLFVCFYVLCSFVYFILCVFFFIALNAITYPTSTSSSNFYVTLPGLVRSPESSVRSVVVEQFKDEDTKRMVNTSFNHLIFMPLRGGAVDIREIEVDIIDPSTGETVKFKDGKSLYLPDIPQSFSTNRGQIRPQVHLPTSIGRVNTARPQRHHESTRAIVRGASDVQ